MFSAPRPPPSSTMSVTLGKRRSGSFEPAVAASVVTEAGQDAGEAGEGERAHKASAPASSFHLSPSSFAPAGAAAGAPSAERNKRMSDRRDLQGLNPLFHPAVLGPVEVDAACTDYLRPPHAASGAPLSVAAAASSSEAAAAHAATVMAGHGGETPTASLAFAPASVYSHWSGGWGLNVRSPDLPYSLLLGREEEEDTTGQEAAAGTGAAAGAGAEAAEGAWGASAGSGMDDDGGAGAIAALGPGAGYAQARQPQAGSPQEAFAALRLVKQKGECFSSFLYSVSALDMATHAHLCLPHPLPPLLCSAQEVPLPRRARIGGASVSAQECGESQSSLPLGNITASECILLEIDLSPIVAATASRRAARGAWVAPRSCPHWSPWPCALRRPLRQRRRGQRRRRAWPTRR